MSRRKTNIDVITSEFERRLARFDASVIRGRSMSQTDVEKSIVKMQDAFDRMIKSLKQCAAYHGRCTKTGN